LKFGRGRLQQRIGEGVTSSTGVGDVVEVTLTNDTKATGKLVRVNPDKITLEIGGTPKEFWVSEIKRIDALAPS